ncbi:MAG: type IV toxin-antitoxin system AbiEi family antitoxin [Gammaproteobacteria bacterium]
MGLLDRFVEDRLVQGQATFSRKEAEAALGIGKDALTAALTRLARRKRLVSPRKGFFLILRPEDRIAGAPDPAQWIDPLMRALQLDYRVSLLRAAAFHGASHQAAMVFQVVVPHQLRGIEAGRQRVEFLYQAPASFAKTNQTDALDRIKTNAGYARVAGVELTLLDCARYFHKAGGMSGIAQVTKDIGGKAMPRRLAQLAAAYETSCVRRLGYLLEHAAHARQAKALEPFARKAKTAVLLDPSVKAVSSVLSTLAEKDMRWKLVINERVEVDY